MTFDQFKILFRMTLTDPRRAGHDVIAMHWPMQGLWLALMLMAVLLSLSVSGMLRVVPLPPDEVGQFLSLSPAYNSPLIFAVINWGQSVITVFVLHWIGNAVGGKGEVRDMLTVMIWLQVVSFALAVFLFVLALALPVIGGLLMLLAFFWGIWAMIALIDAAHRFDNMIKSFGIFVVSILAIRIGVTIISAIFGGLRAVGA